MKRAGLAALLTLAAVCLPSPAGAQVPRTPDGKPDLSGVWWPGRDLQIRPLTPPPAANAAPPAAPPAAAPRAPARSRFPSLYQPWAAEKAKTLSDKDDP